MKARYIKKLRTQISQFDTYLIRCSCGLFGDFFGNNRLGLTLDDYHITADSHLLAVRRFFRLYERMFKRRNDNYISSPIETTQRWGRVMAENERTGYTKFYR